MPIYNQAGLNVGNFYGARDTGTTYGVEQSSDSIHQLSIAFTGASLQDGYVPNLVLPKGALFKRYVLRVDEAFNLTGTNPTIIFGSVGAEATNGIILTEAELEAIGTKTPASVGTGTWANTSATGIPANTKIGKVYGGTTPVVASNVGRATLTAEFFFKTKV